MPGDRMFEKSMRIEWRCKKDENLNDTLSRLADENKLSKGVIVHAVKPSTMDLQIGGERFNKVRHQYQGELDTEDIDVLFASVDHR